MMKIDELIRDDHFYLNENDHCFYMGEYTPRKGATYSKTNQLILNFKKSLEKKGRPEYAYKGRAIEQIAGLIRSQKFDLDKVTFIPVPPSKNKNDPLYDDRLIRVLESYNKSAGGMVDYREIITQTESTEAFHDAEQRPKPDDLMDIYRVDVGKCKDVKESIIIFDDMITSGCHFRACKDLLAPIFPGKEIFGVFVARRLVISPFENIDSWIDP